MTIRRRLGLLVLLATSVLLLQSCATQPVPPVPDPPGFLLGLLHGFLILFSFIGSRSPTCASTRFRTPAVGTTLAICSER